MKPRQRSYQAAKLTDLTATWTLTPQRIDDILLHQLRPLKARSRTLYRNNTNARRYVSLVKTHVIGPSGIVYRPHVMMAQSTPDDAANDMLQTQFKTWGKRQHCEHDGCLSWVQMQRLFMMTWAIDGEVLAYKIRGRQAGDYGLRLKFLDTELLDIHYRDDLRNGHKIRFGIEFDPEWRRVAYYIRDDAGPRQSNGQRYARIEARHIIHEFIPEFPGQKRGIPPMVAGMLKLHMLGEYETAALVNAREGANKMGFYTEPEDETGEPIADPEADLTETSAAGHFEKLPKGWQFQDYDPTYPTGDYEPFTKTAKKDLAAGFGVAHHSLSGDLEGVNYSSARTGSLEERDQWKELQNWCIEAFCEPVNEEWLSVGLVRGMFPNYGAADFDYLDKKDFQGRRWQWVDPLKDMTANEKALANRLVSISGLIRERGDDPAAVWHEIQRDNAELKRLGIEIKEKPAAAGFLKPDDLDDEKEED